MSIFTDLKVGYDGHYNDGSANYYLADVMSWSDYYPFGMKMPGRNANTTSYRYGFNGMEKDDELKGDGNHYTTLFRLNDPRIGRWLSVDPKFGELPWQSPYSSMDNNPIILTDPLGDKVRNGDRIVADQKKSNQEMAQNELDNFMSDKKLTLETKRKDFLSNGGEKADWKQFRKLKGTLNRATRDYEKADARAKITQGIIDKWKKTSPNLFQEVDEKEVDFVLYSEVSEILLQNGHYGYTVPGYRGNKTNAQAPKSMKVAIADDVLLTSKDPETGQFSLNHEAGHFLYIALYTCDYVEYYYNAHANKTYVKGGHGKNDESGKVADRLGRKKDIPKGTLVIYPSGN